jgi:ribosome-associated translation inhibitor RaiA
MGRRSTPTRHPPADEAFPLALVADEQVPEELRQRARQVIAHAARVSARPVLAARVVLRVHHDPALQRPALASASLDVNGRIIRAHVEARVMHEAIDLMADRLRRNLDDLEATRRAHRHVSRRTAG